MYFIYGFSLFPTRLVHREGRNFLLPRISYYRFTKQKDPPKRYGRHLVKAIKPTVFVAISWFYGSPSNKYRAQTY